MGNPIIRIHNVSTDEIIDREMTDDEYTEYKIIAKKTLEKANQENEKIKSKASALTKLAALGLTEDEIAAL